MEAFLHGKGQILWDVMVDTGYVQPMNLRANVDMLPYNDHDRAVKLLHSLDRTIRGRKFEAIVESEKYDTLPVNELFSKLKSVLTVNSCIKVRL
jgi:hypothetical protein